MLTRTKERPFHCSGKSRYPFDQVDIKRDIRIASSSLMEMGKLLLIDARRSMSESVAKENSDLTPLAEQFQEAIAGLKRHLDESLSARSDSMGVPANEDVDLYSRWHAIVGLIPVGPISSSIKLYNSTSDHYLLVDLINRSLEVLITLSHPEPSFEKTGLSFQTNQGALDTTYQQMLDEQAG